MLPALAGQFLTWRFLDRQGWTRGNPYSLSAAPDGRGLRITVKELGDNSTRLRALRPGTPVLFEGRFGRLTARARTRRRVALIGAGVGVAPLRALAEGLEYAPGDAVLLQRFTDRPLFERELHLLAIRRGLQVLWLPGHRRAPGSWLGDGVGAADDVTALTWWVPDLAERDVCVCGPEEWIETVRRVTRAAGLPRTSSMSRSSGGDLAMKRIVYWLLGTVTVVVLLLGYRTSLAGPWPARGGPSPPRRPRRPVRVPAPGRPDP